MNQITIMKAYRDLYEPLIKPDIKISCGFVEQSICNSVILTVVDKLIKLVEKLDGNKGAKGFASLIFSLLYLLKMVLPRIFCLKTSLMQLIASLMQFMTKLQANENHNYLLKS